MERLCLIAAAGCLLLCGPALARPGGPDPARSVAFSCKVSGAAKGIDPAAACALFKRQLDAALARPSTAAAKMPGRGNAVHIAIRFVSSREVSATAIVRSSGRLRNYPELTQDVMDKSVSLRDLELLAKQVTNAVVG